MDSDILQIDRHHAEIPVYYLQYSYFLNRNATKQICVGIDRINYGPYININAFLDNSFVNLTLEDWVFFRECEHEITRYLNGEINFVYGCNDDWIIKSNDDVKRAVNIITIDNNNKRQVSFDLEEWVVLQSYAPFLTRIAHHYNSIGCVVKEFYREYMFHCWLLHTKKLDISQYFKPEYTCSGLNFFRLFNEITAMNTETIEY